MLIVYSSTKKDIYAMMISHVDWTEVTLHCKIWPVFSCGQMIIIAR